MSEGMALSMDKLRDFLENEGIHTSYHRLKILEYLRNHRTHPTVERMHKELSREIPTLSKTTVYNTLKLFVREGIASELTIEEKEVRYDADTKPHAHFKCIECGSVYDIALESPLFEHEMIEGHKIAECHIYLKGVCNDCLKRQKNKMS